MVARRMPLSAAIAAYSIFITSCATAPPRPSPAQASAPAQPTPGEQGQPVQRETKFKKGARTTVGVLTDLPGIGALKIGPNKRTGFDNDLVLWLSTKIGFEPRYIDVTIVEREPALITEPLLADAIFAAFSITDDRKGRIDFAGPYLINKQGVMVRAKETRILTISDLETKTLCAPRGSTSLRELQARKLKVTEEESVEQCIENLKNETVDGVSTDQLLLYGRAEKDSSLRVLPKLTFGYYENYGIGLPKNSGADCKLLTEHIKEFIKSGAWEDFFIQNFPKLATEADEYKPKPDALEKCSS
ncbi:transporter substrate-binding domain-containing protein [Nonomuraea insulae]|uniref:Transporter substrate-binding domain-containing protein n=1 Tax=Nonomuraea insulae TaxID=1616787 RepID=A0ABW1CTY7_9ACTN